MGWLEKWRHRRRRILGTAKIHYEIHQLNTMIIHQNRDLFARLEELRDQLAEVRGLLGLRPDDVPATKEEIEGRDPHGL